MIIIKVLYQRVVIVNIKKIIRNIKLGKSMPMYGTPQMRIKNMIKIDKNIAVGFLPWMMTVWE